MEELYNNGGMIKWYCFVKWHAHVAIWALATTMVAHLLVTLYRHISSNAEVAFTCLLAFPFLWVHTSAPWSTPTKRTNNKYVRTLFIQANQRRVGILCGR